jgi:hypothetical protein
MMPEENNRNPYYPKQARLFTEVIREGGKTYVHHYALAQMNDGFSYWSRADILGLKLIPIDQPRGYWNRCLPGIDWRVVKEAGPDIVIAADFTFVIP